MSIAQFSRHAEIAGAGFSGLVAAIALRQRGWTVTLHEKADELRAFGAGIYIWENGLRVLEALGAADPVLKSSSAPPVYETRFHGCTVSREIFSGIRLRTMTRAVLHGALVASARKCGVEILTSSEAVGAHACGKLLMASGEVRCADMVVGADGVGSNVRDSLSFTQQRNKSRDGITRLLVPRKKTELGSGEWDNIIDFWRFKPRILRILYSPCDEENLYLGFMAPRADVRGSATPIDADYWNTDFPELRPVIEEAAKVQGRYDGYETTVLNRWVDGRVVLIGDAAHAMCPALAQGAGCGMMNAFTLAHWMSQADDIVAGLPQWEAAQRGITDRCQSRSAYFAGTRSMSKGNQFTLEVLETAAHDVTAHIN